MESLNKSQIDAIDAFIDEFFAEEAIVKASKLESKEGMIKDQKPAKETADEAMAQVPKSEKDEDRDEGRPEQISDIPQKDMDGDRAGKYDEKIARKNEDGKNKEQDQVKVPEMMRKSLSDAEFEEYQELRKARQESIKLEALEKARKEQSDLIKSAVLEASTVMRKENEELRKSLAEQGALIKSMANKPQKSKAITSVQALEKFEKSHTGSSDLSKSELLDVAEALVKSRSHDFTMEHAIELENTGYVFDKNARAALEREAKKRHG